MSSTTQCTKIEKRIRCERLIDSSRECKAAGLCKKCFSLHRIQQILKSKSMEDFSRLKDEYKILANQMEKKEKETEAIEKIIKDLNTQISLLYARLNKVKEIEEENIRFKKENKKNIDFADKIDELTKENSSLKEELKKFSSGYIPLKTKKEKGILTVSSLITQLCLYIPFVLSSETEEMKDYITQSMLNFKENMGYSSNVPIPYSLKNSLNRLNINSENEDDRYENIFRELYLLDNSDLEYEFIKYKAKLENSFVDKLKGYIIIHYNDADTIMSRFKQNERNNVFKTLMILFHPRNIAKFNEMVIFLTSYKERESL